MGITERAAYLKGLAEGLQLNQESNEGKILSAALDLLEDMALEIKSLRADQEDISDRLDSVSDDLEDVEEILFGNEAGYGGDEDAETRYSIRCPECGGKVIFDEDALESGEIICPECGQTLTFDLSGQDDEEN